MDFDLPDPRYETTAVITTASSVFSNGEEERFSVHEGEDLYPRGEEDEEEEEEENENGQAHQDYNEETNEGEFDENGQDDEQDDDIFDQQIESPKKGPLSEEEILRKYVLPNGVVSTFKNKEQRDRSKQLLSLKKCKLLFFFEKTTTKKQKITFSSSFIHSCQAM